MREVSDTRTEKAQELRDLARQFRLKAEETQLLKYVDLMRRSATELERLADQIDGAAELMAPVARYG
jgi:hypothetical protein